MHSWAQPLPCPCIHCSFSTELRAKTREGHLGGIPIFARTNRAYSQASRVQSRPALFGDREGAIVEFILYLTKFRFDLDGGLFSEGHTFHSVLEGKPKGWMTKRNAGMGIADSLCRTPSSTPHNEIFQTKSDKPAILSARHSDMRDKWPII